MSQPLHYVFWLKNKYNIFFVVNSHSSGALKNGRKQACLKLDSIDTNSFFTEFQSGLVLLNLHKTWQVTQNLPILWSTGKSTFLVRSAGMAQFGTSWV